MADQPNVANAKHLLDCSHCIGKSCTYFSMKCEVLKDMGDGRLKVRVFGELNWKGRDHLHRIRYVPKSRVWPNPSLTEETPQCPAT